MESMSSGFTNGVLLHGWLFKKGGTKDGQRNLLKGGSRKWAIRWVTIRRSRDGASTLEWTDLPGGVSKGAMRLRDAVRLEPDDNLAKHPEWAGRQFCVRSGERDLHLRVVGGADAEAFCVWPDGRKEGVESAHDRQCWLEIMQSAAANDLVRQSSAGDAFGGTEGGEHLPRSLLGDDDDDDLVSWQDLDDLSVGAEHGLHAEGRGEREAAAKAAQAGQAGQAASGDSDPSELLEEEKIAPRPVVAAPTQEVAAEAVVADAGHNPYTDKDDRRGW